MASIPTQEEIVAATRKSQEAMIAAIKSWLETIRTATPNLTSVYAPLTERLPKLPSVNLPFADKLPTPGEAVDNAYYVAEQLLASQRKFTEDLLEAMTPLIPSLGESSAKAGAEVPSRRAWQEAVTVSQPKPVTVSEPKPAVAEPKPVTVSEPKLVAEPKPVTVSEPKPAAEPKAPARRTAKSTPARPAPKTAASAAKSTATGTAPAKSTAAKSTPAKSTPAKDAAAKDAAAKGTPNPTSAGPVPNGTDAS